MYRAKKKLTEFYSQAWGGGMMNPIEKDRDVTNDSDNKSGMEEKEEERERREEWSLQEEAMPTFLNFFKRCWENTRRRWGLCIHKYPKKEIKLGTTILFTARASRNMEISRLARRYRKIFCSSNYRQESVNVSQHALEPKIRRTWKGRILPKMFWHLPTIISRFGFYWINSHLHLLNIRKLAYSYLAASYNTCAPYGMPYIAAPPNVRLVRTSAWANLSHTHIYFHLIDTHSITTHVVKGTAELVTNVDRDSGGIVIAVCAENFGSRSAIS